MKLTYMLALEDIVKFNEYHSQHSPFMRRTRTRLLIYSPLSILFILSLFGLVAHSWYYPIVGVVFAAITAALMPRRFRRHVRRAVVKCYREGQNKGLIGSHDLEITSDGVIERNPTGSQFTSWAGIERVEQTPTHGFIYVSSNAAHVIPVASVTEGDFHEFMQAVSARRDETNPQPPPGN